MVNRQPIYNYLKKQHENICFCSVQGMRKGRWNSNLEWQQVSILLNWIFLCYCFKCTLKRTLIFVMFETVSPLCWVELSKVGISLCNPFFLTPPLCVFPQGVHTSERIATAHSLPASSAWITGRSVGQGYTCALHTRDQWTRNARRKVTINIWFLFALII